MSPNRRLFPAPQAWLPSVSAPVDSPHIKLIPATLAKEAARPMALNWAVLPSRPTNGVEIKMNIRMFNWDNIIGQAMENNSCRKKNDVAWFTICFLWDRVRPLFCPSPFCTQTDQSKRKLLQIHCYRRTHVDFLNPQGKMRFMKTWTVFDDAALS